MVKETSSLNPTSRFSNRVSDYVKFRPTYPDSILEFFEKELGLSGHELVADIGSGTGIFSELFLKRGYPVAAVEPNNEMRAAAEERLAGYHGFRSTAGTAESTGLDSGSVAFITAAQAFHWFDTKATKAEFQRILRPGGVVALIWNERRTTTPFAREYESFIRDYSPDYEKVKHANVAIDELSSFLGPHGYVKFPNHQELEFEGLVGRVCSSSYAPTVSDPVYPAMKSALSTIFQKYQASGKIRIEYDTKVYFARW